MVIWLGHSTSDMRVLFTWQVEVVQTGMSLSGAEKSLDFIGLEALTEERSRTSH
jgi:hypothetical protein